MENQIETINIDVISHYHLNWFEVEKKEDRVIIMCPEGCRRQLTKWGEVLTYDKEKQEWVKMVTNDRV